MIPARLRPRLASTRRALNKKLVALFVPPVLALTTGLWCKTRHSLGVSEQRQAALKLKLQYTGLMRCDSTFLLRTRTHRAIMHACALKVEEALCMHETYMYVGA